MKIKYWLLATRPKTLAAGLSPVVLGCLLALQHQSLDWLLAFITGLCALLIQIGTNFVNDVSDFKKGADNDHRKGPTRMVQAGHICPEHMTWGAISCFSIAFLLGLILVMYGGWIFLLIGLSGILSGILYTAGPYALAYLGLGDLFVFVYFGPIAVMGTYYLQTAYWDLDAAILGVAIGCVGVSLLAVNNTRDIDEDRVAEKKTLVVRFGKRFGQMEYISCICINAMIIAYMNWTTLLSQTGVILLGLWSLHLCRHMLRAKPDSWDRLLSQTGLLFILTPLVVFL